MIADVDLLAVGQFRLQLLGENSDCSKAADQLDALARGNAVGIRDEQLRRVAALRYLG
jgi:hypothetical protein